MENQYLICTLTEMFTLDESFGLNFAKMVYTNDSTEGFEINSKALENIDEIVFMILENICCEDEVLIVMESLSSLDYKKNIKEVANKYKIDEECIKHIMSRAYKRARHPIYSNILLGKISPCKLIYNKYDTFYYETLEENFIKEISNIVDEKSFKKRKVYLQAISKRYDFVIKSEEHKMIPQEDKDKESFTHISELNLSVRSYNTLIRRGILSIEDLIEFGKSKLEDVTVATLNEIENSIRLYNFQNDPYHAVTFNQKGKETVFKYFSGDSSRVVQSIYATILSMRPGKKTLFKPTFSPGLTELLLLKGYLFLDDITNDYDELIDCLESAGFLNFVNEIRLYEKYKDYKEDDKEKAVATPLYEELNEELAKNNCRTIENTLDYFNNNILDSDNAIYKLVDTLLDVF